MSSIGDYNIIMSDRNIFNSIVYTPLSEALNIIRERRNDPSIVAKIEELLKGDIPEVLKDNICGIQFRQIATPNHDARHFLSITTDNGLKPVFFEYLDDKFTSNNEFKHSLGQLRIHGEVNKNDSYPIEKITIVDFANHDGKKLRDVLTVWNEPLQDFHRKLFKVHKHNIDDITFYDASEWLHRNGGTAKEYYKNFFLLLICNGVLFENFLLNDDDALFTQNIVLPSIDFAIAMTGLKPLIVPIGPLDMETDSHWISYHQEIKKIIPN